MRQREQLLKISNICCTVCKKNIVLLYFKIAVLPICDFKVAVLYTFYIQDLKYGLFSE